MGYNFMDKYSILHFAVGVVAYFWNINFATAIMFHIIFEILENTETGMSIINKWFVNIGGIKGLGWPGGKTHPDSKLNSLGDTIFFALGWLISYIIFNFT